MRKLALALFIGVALGCGTESLLGCESSTPAPPMVLDTDAEYNTVIPTGDVVPLVGDLGSAVDEVM